MQNLKSLTRTGLVLACAVVLAAFLACVPGMTQKAHADVTTASAEFSISDYATASTQVAENELSTNIFRLYNPNSGEHFYTSSFNETMSLVTVGWNYEGIAWKSEAKAAGDAVYRLYNPNAGDHHYTISESEKDNLVSKGWNYEGITYYAAKQDANGATAVYRLYNPNAVAGAHHFTTSADERDSVVKAGWTDEKTAWYAYPAGSLADASETGGTVYTIYNPNTGEHFFTTSQAEVVACVKAGWAMHEKTWTSLAKDATTPATATPVFRMYNSTLGDHFYTISTSDRDSLLNSGWKVEGTAFYAAATDATDSSLKMVYRIDNPNVTSGAHYYTTNTEEYDKLAEIGWKKIGPAWKIL